jgi:hypothetical protein
VDDVTDVLHGLASTLADLPSDRPLTARLCEACRRLLGVDGTVISIDGHPGGWTRLCATDPLADRLDEVQQFVAEGPSRMARDTGHPVIAPLDRSVREHWPLLAALVGRLLPAQVIVAVPMRRNRSRPPAGVMTSYQTVPRALALPLQQAQVLADAVCGGIAHHLPTQQDDDFWTTRDQTEVAVGMVMAQLHLSADDALAMLRAHAFAHDESMTQTVESVLSMRLTFQT